VQVQALQLPSLITCLELVPGADPRFIVATKGGLHLFHMVENSLEQLVGPVGTGGVLSLDVLRNGKQVLTAGEDGYLRFYTTADLAPIRAIRMLCCS
jgi:hypothetical protein